MASRRPIRTPDIPELRAFCSAADLGTLGRAAIALRISQPALSKRLRSLEAIAGASLLDRSPSGVTLTDAGRRLYPEARRLLDQAEVVEGLLGGVAEQRTPLRLAVSHTIAEFHLPPELVAHQADGVRRNPIELTVANSHAVRRMVADGGAEIGITARDAHERVADRLEELELLADEVIVAVPESHPWHHRRSIPTRLLLSTPLVMRDPGAHDRRCVEAVLAEKGLGGLSPLVEVGSTSVAKREALQRSAPVMLSRLALDTGRDRLEAKPVEGLAFERRFVIVVRSSGTLSRDEREFVAFLRRRRKDGADVGAESS